MAGEKEKGEGMSDVLTTEYVVNLPKWAQDLMQYAYDELRESHEALRARYEALLKGATTGAKSARDEIKRLTGQVEDTRSTNVNLHTRIAALEKERDVAIAERDAYQIRLLASEAWGEELASLIDKDRIDWCDERNSLLACRDAALTDLADADHERDAILSQAIAERDASTTRAEVAESQRDEFAASVKRVSDQRDGLQGAIEVISRRICGSDCANRYKVVEEMCAKCIATRALSAMRTAHRVDKGI